MKTDDRTILALKDGDKKLSMSIRMVEADNGIECAHFLFVAETPELDIYEDGNKEVLHKLEMSLKLEEWHIETLKKMLEAVSL